MRGLIWLTLLFAVAAGFAVLATFNHGQVVMLVPPYRVDVSLNLFVLAMLALFVALYVIIRVLRNIYKMPERVAAYRNRQRSRRANIALRDAVANLFAGRYTRAEKAAREAAEQDDNRGVAAIIGARAAHRMREFARRDAWLDEAQGANLEEARLLQTAELRVDARDAQGALDALTEMRAQGARRMQAQLVALRAHQHLKHWPEVLGLLKMLEKREALHPALAAKLKQTASEGILRDHRHDADALLKCWQELPADARTSSRIADVAAELLVALDRPREARDIVEAALAEHWDARLLRRYAECAGGDALPLIQKAEAWQQRHPNDPDLLYALGKLCQHQRLWGKAQTFLEGALRYTDDRHLQQRVHLALAQLFEGLGQMEQANRHYRACATA
ncbi:MULTISPECIES: heme biosynthesis protein HemY [Pandoraea]|jgi:HemY protein|uniref:Heme biosynthesis protein HemY n=1 Tax=Pandoraea pnomenusa TaxID=93220 RepID=A0A378YXI1_9BURK|nr:MULTISPECIES: heme biosynthesis protein HemY [Pandoraea]AHB06931.1 heme biosynthesis protein HemY [Pandoraea pnomenusa 3kgm]AHB76951.1 heme biosynthesis protein HemY [Pandoraea pnomenusa]AHN74739.1 heme biosynthesis protein HemY [Pandoraea pnomenusa]AIU28742.1 heme biosynthesis protein HemY [Pandoraea pnomenusa]MBN9095060.1 heme biosynthesis protein HemY [Pandoraea pnomenusa]